MANIKDSEVFPVPTTIFALIHELHATISDAIDTSLSWDTLNSPPINYSLVRPIVERFTPQPPDEKAKGALKLAGTQLLGPPKPDRGESGDGTAVQEDANAISFGGVLYALMVNRIRFITLAGADLSSAPLQSARAAFCELLAMKILRTFPNPSDEAELVGQLVKGWCPFEGASETVWASMGSDAEEIRATTGSALELAIVSSSKHFLSLPLVQHLVNEIYLGHLVYSPVTSRALISDSYVSEGHRQRRRASHSHPSSGRPSPAPSDPTGETESEVFTYNPFEAGWLDHRRLRVPRWRWWMEVSSFTVLLVLFVTLLSLKDVNHLSAAEIVFIIFTLGFALDEFATSKEHGWTVYAANAWNAFDMTFIVIFFLYLVLRIIGLASRSSNASDLAFDILACGACILFPRLVFFLIKDNVIILALRAMISRFISFMGLTILAFSGICFCLWTLARGTWSVRQIVWLMLQIWFGSSYLGFSSSESFHPIFGPIVLIGYAALCNVLLITILIALLSNKFAEINNNAQEEHLFQRVIATVEGVKSDAVFSYYPPVNLLAFTVLLPLSWICSPRTLHRVNVFAIRLTSFPVLLLIAVYERLDYRRNHRSIHLRGNTFDSIGRSSLFDSFLGGGSEILINTVFEAGPPQIEDLNVILTPPAVASTASSEAGEAPVDSRRQSRAYGYDSPLAKLFGKGVSASAPPPGPAPKLATKIEIDALQSELKEMRASQLRVEELLSKMMTGGSSK